MITAAVNEITKLITVEIEAHYSFKVPYVPIGVLFFTVKDP